MANIPLVSVVLPVYNAAPYLGKAIRSILNQTYRNLELIIIDDCSTDNSLEIINRFQDTRIKLLKNDNNMAIAYSLNRGMKAAQGKYIARMDADDESLPKRLERQINFLESNSQIDICGSSIQIIGTRSRWSVKEDHKMIHAALLFDCPLFHPTVVFRTESFRAVNLSYDEARGRQKVEDYALWINAAEQLTLANIDIPLLRYRYKSSGIDEPRIRAANALRRQLLMNAGIIFSDDELLLHYSLCSHGRFSSEPSYIEDVAKWFGKLLMTNQSTHFFDQPALERILEEKLWRVFLCTQKSTTTAWKVYRSTNFKIPRDIKKTEALFYSAKGVLLSYLSQAFV